MAVKQDIDIPVVATVGIVGAMLLLIIIWGVEAWYAYETDFVHSQRYRADQNLSWIALKEEQYENLWDTVGNQIVYAGPVSFVVPGPAAGYRWINEDRTAAAIPIHEAMAILVNRHGGQTTGEEMREWNRRHAAAVNEAFNPSLTAGETGGGAPGGGA